MTFFGIRVQRQPRELQKVRCCGQRKSNPSLSWLMRPRLTTSQPTAQNFEINGGCDLSRTSSAIRRLIYSQLGLPIFLHIHLAQKITGADDRTRTCVNYSPLAWKASALPTELHPHYFCALASKPIRLIAYPSAKSSSLQNS